MRQYSKGNKEVGLDKGFTIIELLVVISIIGILSAVVLVSLQSGRHKARDTVRVSDIHQIIFALELFFENNAHYPGTPEGVSSSGEFIGDDSGPIEMALGPYLSIIPEDPRHNGVDYYYSYDPQHCTDLVFGSCACDGPPGAVVAFNKAEGGSVILRKDTCSGGDMNQDTADYNIVLYPAAQ